MKSSLICIMSLIVITLWGQYSESVFTPQVSHDSEFSIVSQQPEYMIVDGITEEIDSPVLGVDNLFEAILNLKDTGIRSKSLFSYRYRKAGMDLDFDLNVLAGYEYTYNADYSYGYLYKGLRVNTIINDIFRLRSDWNSGAFLGDAYLAIQHSPLVDGFYKHDPEHIWIDNLSGDIAVETQNYRLALSRDRYQVGNSFSGSIILNKQVNDYANLNGELKLGKFSLALLHASIGADTTLYIYDDDVINSKNYPDKYLALHQINFRPIDEIDLFFGEIAVYGNRSIDINYLLPHAFWRVLEHNLWDKDNMMIYLGGDLRFKDDALFYAHTLIDEMRYAELFGNWWGNKYALQTGLEINLDKRSNTNVNLEFTAVRPWIYTHFLPFNYYSHDKRPLGYHKGTNLIDYSAGVSGELGKYHRYELSASYTRQGSVGNSYSLNYLELIDDIDNTQTRWLEGDITDIMCIRAALQSSLFSHHRFIVGIEANYIEDWDLSLNASWQLVY